MERVPLLLDTSVRRNVTSTPSRVAVVYAESGCYLVEPVDDPISAAPGLLLTGEHVQAYLERAGHRLEAHALDALFHLDEVVRLTSPPQFLILPRRRGPIGVVTGQWGAVTPLVRGSLPTDAEGRAAAVLRAVAPIGYRSLTDPRLSRPGADEIPVFGQLLDRLHGRRGVRLRELQDWVMARAAGDPTGLAAAKAALTTGPELSRAAYDWAVRGLDRKDSRRTARTVRSRPARSHADSGPVAL